MNTKAKATIDRDTLAYSAADIAEMSSILTGLAITTTMLVTETTVHGPASPGDRVLTPGQLLDLQLLEVALRDGEVHELVIKFTDPQMWAGTKELFKEWHDPANAIIDAYGHRARG